MIIAKYRRGLLTNSIELITFKNIIHSKIVDNKISINKSCSYLFVSHLFAPLLVISCLFVCSWNLFNVGISKANKQTNKQTRYNYTILITRLIVIDIAPLAVLFCNWPLFCNWLLLKDITFNTKCLLVWCD